MKIKSIAANSLAVISLTGMLYCFAAFLYIQPLLIPALTAPTETIRLLGDLTVPFYFLAGVYHVVLLVNALKVIAADGKSRFLHSLSFQ